MTNYEGYTGRLIAEHISIHLPSDVKWAVAGRTRNKLEKIIARCKELSPNRIQPGSANPSGFILEALLTNSRVEIEVCGLEYEDVLTLAKKTFCFIAAVGPYALYGESAFRACAESGTHYLDCTPEVPWTLEMIKKYEAIAKATGAIMIPQCAMESAPSDILTWMVAQETRYQLNSEVGDVVMDLHQLE